MKPNILKDFSYIINVRIKFKLNVKVYTKILNGTNSSR